MSTRPITKNSMAGSMLDLAQRFSDESFNWPVDSFTAKQLRYGAKTLKVAATLVHQGTWDRDTAEAWRDSATITLKRFREARNADQ